MSIILIILIVVIIGLLIKIYDYKKTNSELSKQNKELTNKIELLVGPSQQTSEQINKDTQYASHPPMTFSEEDVEAWKHLKLNNLKFGINTVKYRKRNLIMISNLVDHLIIQDTLINTIQIQSFLYVSCFY